MIGVITQQSSILLNFTYVAEKEHKFKKELKKYQIY